MAHLATPRSRSPQGTVDPALTRPAKPSARSRLRPSGTLVIVGVWILVWEALGHAGVLSALFFPVPSVIGERLVELIANGEMATHVRATLFRLVPGLLLGGVTGLVIGMMMGWSTRIRAIFDPLVAAAHPVPKIAIFPLIMVIFGIGNISKIVAISISVFFPMLINTMAGVRQISPLHLEVATNYGASLWRLFSRVVLPGSLPSILYGLRIALNVSLGITIASEIAASVDGLGAQIWLAWEVLNTETLYANLIVIAAIGVGFAQTIQLLLRRLVPWQMDRTPATR